MKKYMVSRYEIHEFPVVVEAEDELDAIERAVAGEGETPDDVTKLVGDTYVETDESRGMPIPEFLMKYPHIDKKRVYSSGALAGDLSGEYFSTVRGVMYLGESDTKEFCIRSISTEIREFRLKAKTVEEALARVEQMPSNYRKQNGRLVSDELDAVVEEAE